MLINMENIVLNKKNKFEFFFVLSAFTGVLAYLIHFHYLPFLSGNESVYFVKAAMLNDPVLFKNDWTLTNNSFSFGSIFDYYLRPFYWFSNDPITIAKHSRLVLWLFVIACFTYLGKTLKLSFLSIFVALNLYLLLGQGQFAGAWIFGGAEQKVIAYGFLFLSLASLVQKRYVICGLLAGITFYAHVIIGGWNAIALCLVLLFRFRSAPYSLLKFSALSLPVAMLVLGFHYFSGLDLPHNAGHTEINVYELLVTFRIPHHIDPNSFLNINKLMIFLMFFSLGIYFIFRGGLSRGTKDVAAILTLFGLFFIIGIVARQLNMYFFLNLYPFRLADALYPLFLCLFVVETLFIYIKERLKKSPNFTTPAYIFLVIILSLPFIKIMQTPKITIYPSMSPDFIKMSNWIKGNTEKNAVFAVNPCNPFLWMMAERAMVVNFKYAPVGYNFAEWYQRLVTLNGGNSLAKRGGTACLEFKKTFSDLSINKLVEIREAYGANYYLTNKNRSDLYKILMIQVGDSYLYDIGRMERVGIL
ncbi:MAG: hypothetical protein ACI8XG_000902 [Congregibacter sp.]|jgi:hypothetical protein